MPNRDVEKQRQKETGTSRDRQADGGAGNHGDRRRAPSEPPAPRSAETSINTEIYKDPNRILPA